MTSSPMQLTAECRFPKCPTGRFVVVKAHREVVRTDINGDTYRVGNVVCPSCGCWAPVVHYGPLNEQVGYLGRMIVGRQPCGRVAAMAWDEPGREEETARQVVDWRLRGLEVVRIERFDEDPPPVWACTPCRRCAETPPPERKDVWRPVGVELPKEGDEGASDDVLVMMADNTMQVAYYDYIARQWSDRWGFFFLPDNVVFWRPLPSGPEKQEAA